MAHGHPRVDGTVDRISVGSDHPEVGGVGAVGEDGSTLAAGSADQRVSLAFSPDGHTLAGGSSDNSVWIWDLAAGKAFALPHPGPVTAVAYLTPPRLPSTPYQPSC